MTVEELIIYGKRHLSSSEAKMLLAHILGLDSLELLLHLDLVVDEEKQSNYFKLIEARLNNYPLQYIIGEVPFLNNNIKVNEHVLIPRPETEDLVFRTINNIKKFLGEKEDLRIVDLGTGSGCIAIAIKTAFPNAKVDAVDISNDALNLAKENAQINNVDINFYLGDMIAFFKDKYDVIISNPPYIADASEVEEIVLKNEPHMALFAPNQGLYYYEKILESATKHLNDKSMIAFEIGYQQGQWIKKISEKFFPQKLFFLEQDMAGKDRFVFIYNDIK